MQNNNMKTAFGYIRVSTHMQEEISPEAQKHEIQKWAVAHNILIIEWFQDNGISGKKSDNRTEFLRMISLAKEKDHPDYIVAWKFSRFARNQEESIVYKSLLRKNDVQVVSVSEPLPDGPFASLIERIIEWMDEYYSIRLAGEVRRGMTEKAKQGGYQCAPPLGYRKEKNSPVPAIYEPEAIIYRAIKKYCLAGYTPTTIARLINDAGYRSRRGNPFELRTIVYILKNPFYNGKIRWNRSVHGGYYENAAEDIIIADGKHEKLCTDEEWDTIQKLIQKYKPGSSGRRKRSDSTLRHYLAGGLMICPVCGSRMAYANGIQPNKKKSYPYFCCWKYSKGMHRNGGHITTKRCEIALLESLHRLAASGDGNVTFYEDNSDSDTAAIDISTYTREIERLKLREQRAKNAYLDGIDTKDEYAENRRIIYEQIYSIQNQIDILSDTSRSDNKKEVVVDLNNLISLLEDDSVSILDKHTALKGVMDHMIYHNDSGEFEMFYRF